MADQSERPGPYRHFRQDLPTPLEEDEGAPAEAATATDGDDSSPAAEDAVGTSTEAVASSEPATAEEAPSTADPDATVAAPGIYGNAPDEREAGGDADGTIDPASPDAPVTDPLETLAADPLGATVPQPKAAAAAHPKSRTRSRRRAPGHSNIAESNRRRKNRGRSAAIALVAVAAVIALVYAAGVVAFSNICYPNTVIAGVDVSLMARETAASRISSAATNYKLTVSYGDDFEWTYDPDSTDELLDAYATFDRIVSANDPYRWPWRLYESLVGTDSTDSEETSEEAETIELPDSFDTEAFTQSVYEAVNSYNSARSGTIDAASAYDEETGQFSLELAQSNRQLDAEAVADAALVALAHLTRTVELDESYLEPLANGATEEELQAAIDTANALIATDVSLVMGGTTVAVLDGEQLALWISFDEDLVPTLAEDEVTAWAEELADDLDTVGSIRTYTRPDGKTISVTGGTFGWSVDAEALVELLQTAVAEQQTGDLEVPTTQAGDVYTAAGEADWGAYVDVDLTEQHAYYYDASGNLLWDSAIITANTNKGYSTPTGVYYINNKEEGTTLLGELDEETGEREYETDVSYWMPFVDNLVGLHDATWQSDASFANSKAYLSVGSHGCVNLPYDAAAELYELVEVGTCVIVHK